MRATSLICVAAASLAAAATADASASALRVGSTKYTRVVHLRGGTLTIGLTAKGRKTFRRVLVGGRILDATCETLVTTRRGVMIGSGSHDAEGWMDARGRHWWHALLNPHADFCDVGLALMRATRLSVNVRQLPGQPLDAVALTQRGAEYLDEDRLAADLNLVLAYASAGDGSFASPVAFAGRWRSAVFGFGVLPLTALDGTPPAGVVGYFSDGDLHAETVAVSATGRRLFVDENGEVSSSNVEEHLLRAQSGLVPPSSYR